MTKETDLMHEFALLLRLLDDSQVKLESIVVKLPDGRIIELKQV